MGKPRSAEAVAKVFWSKVNKTDSCWLWTGGRTTAGYGLISSKGKRAYVHRYSWELFRPIPSGMLICHKCDVRHCVKPTHLFAGTQKDNMDDMKRKGRDDKRAHKGEKQWGHKLTDGKVRLIRAMFNTGRFNHATLGRLFHVDASQSSRVCNRKTWKHVS